MSSSMATVNIATLVSSTCLSSAWRYGEKTVMGKNELGRVSDDGNEGVGGQ